LPKVKKTSKRTFNTILWGKKNLPYPTYPKLSVLPKLFSICDYRKSRAKRWFCSEAFYATLQKSII